MTTGYLTYTQLVNMKIAIDAATLASDAIKNLIDTDSTSAAKRRMAEGQNYYDARHDILDHVNYYYEDGKQVEDVAKANNKLIHPFHRILNNQKVSYLVGNPVIVSVMRPEAANPDAPTQSETDQRAAAERFQAALDPFIDESFDDLLNDWVKDSGNNGIGWAHVYVEPEERGIGKLQTVTINPMECLPVYDSKYQRDLVYMIRYYKYDLVVDGTTVTRYKVEWWDKNKVTYWAQLADKSYALDSDVPVNPVWHWTTTLKSSDGSVISQTDEGWGRVPFIALPNNPEWHTDLMPVKSLIDAYDSVKSGWMNNIDDFSELIYVVKNYAGLSSEARGGLSELAAFIHNVKTQRVVKVEGDGGLDTLNAEIPTEAREKFLQITRKEIFYFGEGVDTDQDKLGNNPSGVALEFQYAGLDEKAKRTERKLKKAISEYMWFVTRHINRSENAKYDPAQIVVSVNKSAIFNTIEKMDALNKDTVMSRRTKIEQHPLVHDVEEELRRIDEEGAESVPVDPPANGAAA